MSEKYTILISEKQAFWVLSMFKRLDRISMVIHGTPMELKPECEEFRERLRKELKNLEGKIKEREE